MNWIQWCDKVWQAAVEVNKNNVASEYTHGIAVDVVAKVIVGDGQKSSREMEDAVQLALEELLTYHVFELPSLVRISKIYNFSRNGALFTETRSSLIKRFKMIDISEIGFQLLTAIANETQNSQDDFFISHPIGFQELQGHVGMIDSTIMKQELDKLHHKKLISGISVINASAPWGNIKITYAGLVRLDRG